MGLNEVPAYMEIKMLLTCKKCGAELEAEEHFYPRKGTKTGYQYECKACRKKINEKYKKPKKPKVGETPKGETPKEEKPRKPTKKRKRWNHKEAHRRKILQAAGACIVEGSLIAETPRTMTFNLSLIIEQQLKLFYGCQITEAMHKPRMRQILDEGMFEIKEALSKIGNRMRRVIEATDGSVDMRSALESLKKARDARILLGVGEDATLIELKAAYRSLARSYHPDHNGSTEAMQKLNEAYALLVEDQNG